MPIKGQIDPTDTFYLSKTVHGSYRIWVSRRATTKHMDAVVEILNSLSAWNGADSNTASYYGWEFKANAILESNTGKVIAYRALKYEMAVHALTIFGFTALTDDQAKEVIY